MTVLFRKYFLFMALIASLILPACSSDKGATPQMAGGMPPALVQVTTVEQKDTPYLEKYICQIEGSKAVDVRAQVSGILKEKTYVEGQFVEAGATMFIIEPNTYQAALNQAQGALAQAQANLNRSKLDYDRIAALYQQNAISKKEYDAAKAAYDTAKGALEASSATLDNAKIQLGRTSVVAPVSGYSSKINYSVGNLISATAALPLTVINQVDPIYVNFSVPANTMSMLRTLATQNKLKTTDLTVRLYLSEDVAYPQIGKVTFFDKQVSATTGDIKVRAEFNNENLILLPGQFANAELLGFTLTNAIIIPQKAMLKSGHETQVIVIDDNNLAHYRPIKTSIMLGNDILIEEGLKAGERIVTDGQHKVSEGAPVQFAQAAAQPQNAPQQPAK